jgi:hypothetical protein
MVETLATRRADQSLAECVRLWHAKRCFQNAKTHRSQGVINSGRKHRIAIVHDQAVRFFACQHAPELLHRLLGRRMFSDVPMHDPPGADVQYQEHVHEPERGRDHHEEIARQGLASVVPHNRPPRCDDERGRDGTSRRMYRRTDRGETDTPNFSSSSAAIRSLPQV